MCNIVTDLWIGITICQETVLLSEQVEEAKTNWKWLLEITSSGIKISV
jgi:hypothetical protein